MRIWEIVKSDLQNRRGIGNAWLECDKEVLAEINQTNLENIKQALAEFDDAEEYKNLYLEASKKRGW